MNLKYRQLTQVYLPDLDPVNSEICCFKVYGVIIQIVVVRAIKLFLIYEPTGSQNFLLMQSRVYVECITGSKC